MHNRTIVAALLVLGCLSMASPVLAAPTTAADQKAIRARRTAYVKAVQGRDIRGAMAVVAPGFKLKQKNGKFLTRAEWQQRLSQIMMRLPNGTSIRSRVEKLVVKGTSAQLTVTDEVSITDEQGKPQTVSQHVRETWKKSGGKWVIASAAEV